VGVPEVVQAPLVQRPL